jgi:hypothetical protein
MAIVEEQGSWGLLYTEETRERTEMARETEPLLAL